MKAGDYDDKDHNGSADYDKMKITIMAIIMMTTIMAIILQQ